MVTIQVCSYLLIKKRLNENFLSIWNSNLSAFESKKACFSEQYNVIKATFFLFQFKANKS